MVAGTGFHARVLHIHLVNVGVTYQECSNPVSLEPRMAAMD